jgi:hypothetical protein
MTEQRYRVRRLTNGKYAVWDDVERWWATPDYAHYSSAIREKAKLVDAARDLEREDAERELHDEEYGKGQ